MNNFNAWLLSALIPVAEDGVSPLIMRQESAMRRKRDPKALGLRQL